MSTESYTATCAFPNCETQVPDYVPEFCCNGFPYGSPCGCQGKPMEPPVCDACAKELF